MQTTVNGMTYHVTTAGEGQPLVLLHGFSGSAQSWARLLPALSVSYRVIAPDLMGHGADNVHYPPERYSMAHVVADVLALCDALELERPHLLGYSMGGRVALACAISAPNRFRSLVLESASPGLATEAEREARRKSDGALAESILHDGIEAFVTRWEALPLWHTQANLPDDVRQAQRQHRLQRHPVGLAHSLLGYGTGAQASYWDALATLDLPTLLLVGEADEKFRRINADMYARLPNAELVTIANAGHTTHLEQPQAFLEAVLGFLSRFDLA
jgi:2-succinyl-6-hydroxy-2,4-cyclohexadiene-1-carboxylate synthase